MVSGADTAAATLDLVACTPHIAKYKDPSQSEGLWMGAIAFPLLSNMGIALQLNDNGYRWENYRTKKIIDMFDCRNLILLELLVWWFHHVPTLFRICFPY